MSLFLQHTAKIFAQDYCVIFLDGAGWHKASSLVIPPTVKLVFLPSYSPELNPTESLWEYLRENHTEHHPFDSLEEVQDCVDRGIQVLLANPKQVQSMTYYRWLKTLSMTSN